MLHAPPHGVNRRVGPGPEESVAPSGGTAIPAPQSPVAVCEGADTLGRQALSTPLKRSTSPDGSTRPEALARDRAEHDGSGTRDRETHHSLKMTKTATTISAKPTT